VKERKHAAQAERAREDDGTEGASTAHFEERAEDGEDQQVPMQMLCRPMREVACEKAPGLTRGNTALPFKNG
jgi:hypothetical protein